MTRNLSYIHEVCVNNFKKMSKLKSVSDCMPTNQK